MAGYADIMGAFEGAMNQARAANAARKAEVSGLMDQRISGYQTAAGKVMGGYADLLKRQEKIGDWDRANIDMNAQRQLGTSQANLFARGLGNSTLLESANRGVNRDKNLAGLQLSDQLARQYANVDMAKLGYQGDIAKMNAALLGDKAKFLENIEDQYPDLGLYSQLAKFAGQGAAGVPGGGGITAGGFGAGSRGYVPTTTGSAMGWAPGLGWFGQQGSSNTGAYGLSGQGQTVYMPVGGDLGGDLGGAVGRFGEAIGAAAGMGAAGVPPFNPFAGAGAGGDPMPGWEFHGFQGGFENPWGMPSNYGAAIGALGNVFVPQNPYGNATDWGGAPAFGGFGGGGYGDLGYSL